MQHTVLTDSARYKTLSTPFYGNLTIYKLIIAYPILFVKKIKYFVALQICLVIP